MAVNLETIGGSDGIQMDLLWTNPSPTASFTAQNIVLSEGNYSMFFVLTNGGTCIINKSESSINTSATVIGGFNSGWGGYNLFVRQVTYRPSNSTMSFADCKIIDENGEQGSRNESNIPQKIYGVKL